jgi:hypothetical protein
VICEKNPFPAYTLGFPCGGGCCLQSPVLGTAAGTNYSSSMEFEEIFTFSSTQPIFLLGEYVYSTLSQGIEDFYGAVYKITRQWTVDFIVQKVLSVMALVNPCLSHHQQALLKPLFQRALDQLIWQRALEPRVIRGLVALACPNQDTGFLFGYLMEILVGLLCASSQSHEALDLKSHQVDVEIPTDPMQCQVTQEKMRVARLLCQHFCIDQVYVAAMPPPVRKVVLEALMGGAEVPSNIQGSSQFTPVCCITLEPLLCPNGTLTPDVVAVIQRSSTISKQHAFLYQGRALYEWLGSSQVPKSPETRSVVLPTDIYRLS